MPVVRHPDGVILVDTGIGEGSDVVEDLYHPEVVPLRAALASVHLAPGDITAVVLSHLHFDHCGQQSELDAPAFVQAAEQQEAQRRPHYTIPEWAAMPPARARLVDGDEEIAEGVNVVATPGHTPGHQSVVIEAGERREVLAAQCAFRADEVYQGEPGPTNLYDESWRDTAHESLARLRGLGPASLQLSHDLHVVQLA